MIELGFTEATACKCTGRGDSTVAIVTVVVDKVVVIPAMVVVAAV